MDKILVVGDPILDTYLIGHICGVATDSPVRVAGNHAVAAGGACNVAANVHALGGESIYVVAAGDSPMLKKLYDVLRITGIPDDHLYFAGLENGPPPSVKTRILAGSQVLARHDDDRGWPAGEGAQPFKDILAPALQQHGDDIGMIVVSDYDKGHVDAEVLAALHEWADPRKVGIIFSGKPRPGRLDTFRGHWGLVFNRHEFLALDGLLDDAGETCNDVNLTILMERAARELGCDNLVVTCGASGAAWGGFRRGEWQYLQADNPWQLHVAETTGCGDTFLAALVVALREGYTWTEGVAMANLAGAVAASRAGTTVVTRGAWRVVMGQRLDPDFKVMAAEVAAEFVVPAHEQGTVVGVVNGCFDIIHPGHLAVIRDCRSRCHLLVVLVDDDEGVRDAKGHGRPYQPLGWRTKVLSSLQDVGIVVPFTGQDQLAAAIEALAPDVMTKGEEYRGSLIPGAAGVEDRGGEVRFVDVPGYSTTDFVESLRVNLPDAGTAGE